jgi:hypothetical protein
VLRYDNDYDDDDDDNNNNYHRRSRGNVLLKYRFCLH